MLQLTQKSLQNSEQQQTTPTLTLVPEPSNTVSTQPKTSKQQLLKPGDIVYSVCRGFIYEIRSYPVCRIYYDYSPNAPYLLSYHAMEGLTAQDKEKGFKKPHLSYLATVHNSTLRRNGEQSLFYITDNGLRLIHR